MLAELYPLQVLLMTFSGLVNRLPAPCVIPNDRCARWGVVDEWTDLRAVLHMDTPSEVHAFPVETISQSEGGLERVYQSSAVVLTWPVALSEGETWNLCIRSEIGQAQSAS